ncbi:MAG: hypothetical protein JW849_02960 [Phycisphaerae bacterium]|nr:hypothetical protein [Phycisphaerae bacterium]
MDRTSAMIGITLLLLSLAAGWVYGENAEQNAPEEKGYFVALKEAEDKAEQIDTVRTAVMEESAQTDTGGWTKPVPLTFSVDYTLATDYIFRGINFSEYRRKWGQAKNEGREKLNHQLTTGAEMDLGKFGRVGGSVWFEWFAGQHYLTPEDGHKNLQEVDYTVYYGYNVEPIGVDAEVGFIWYMFPRISSGDGNSTQELYLNLSFDESTWLRALGLNVKKSILNPYLFQAWDMDLARGGYYGEFGLAPEIALADVGCANTPILKDITFTPSWAMAWDHNWLNRFTLDPAAFAGNEGRGYASNSSHLMNVRFGGNVSFDLKSALNIPEKYCGAMYVNGFMYYSQRVAEHFLNDEFWGGLSVGYEW